MQMVCNWVECTTPTTLKYTELMAAIVKLVLDTRANSQKDDGSYPIVLRLWHQRTNRTVCSLGYYATKTEWDEKAQCLLKSYHFVSNVTRTNNYLIKKRTLAFDVINDLNDSGEIEEISINELNNLIRKRINGDNPKKKIRQTLEKKPLSWEYCKNLYFNYHKNIDIPKHKQRLRSKTYIDDSQLYLNRFEEFFNSPQIDNKISKVSHVTDDVVGKYFEFLEKTTKSNSSFNHHLKSLRTFFNFLIEEKEYQIKNPFRKVALRYEGTNPKTILKHEFDALMEIIHEKDSVMRYKSGTTKNMYRPYLKDTYQLALYTGRRTEEIVNFRWNNIRCDQNNEPLYIESIDLKANRQSNFNQSKATKMVFVPVIPQLKSLLYEMGFEENIGSNTFLIAPDEKSSRRTIINKLSKSFTFYYKKLNTGKNISLKHLRKTYLTHLQILTGNAIAISGHSNEEILDEHYIDGVEIAKSVALSNIKILGG